MKIFDEGNWKGIRKNCPICGLKKKGKVVLIAISGTQKGFNCEAIQVHLECLDLWWDEKMQLIYQRTGKFIGKENSK